MSTPIITYHLKRKSSPQFPMMTVPFWAPLRWRRVIICWWPYLKASSRGVFSHLSIGFTSTWHLSIRNLTTSSWPAVVWGLNISSFLQLTWIIEDEKLRWSSYDGTFHSNKNHMIDSQNGTYNSNKSPHQVWNKPPQTARWSAVLPS